MRLSILSIFNIQIFNYLVILSVRLGCDILWIPAVTSHREKLKKKMRIFRLLLIAAMLVIGGANASAARQNVSEIKGTVLDKATGEPLGWTTVALMRPDSTLAAGATCDDKGAYSLQAAPGEYIIKASLIGYKDSYKNVNVVTGLNEIEPLNMSEDTQMIAGATVTERVKLVEMKIDKLVMNVSQSAFAQGSNALDLIKKAPGVTIDKDGNITLNGKKVQVWIDGRPSYLDGKGLEALLRSTSGSSIDKFELMEHPSAKYDAEGQGGIINIKTKRNALSGLNGEIGTDDGGMYFGETGPSASDAETRFKYRENIGAAYLSLAAQFGPKWTAKAGLRGEYTNSFGDWISAGDESRRSYFDLFPTAFVGFNPSASLRFALSYTRRIQRPDYMALNPVENYIDAHTYNVGDPDLRPAYSDAASLSAGFGQHFSLAASFSHTGGMFSQLPELKENGDQLLIWTNYGRQNMTALTFNVTELPLAKWLAWTFSTTGLYSSAKTADWESNDSFTLSCYTCFTFILPKDWKVQLDGFYRSPIAYGYFKLHDLYSMNIGVKKTMLDNRLVLTLNLDDVLRSSCTNLDCLGFRSSTVLGDVNSSFIGQKYYSQVAHIGLTWRFGKARQTRARKVGGIDEASRIGGGKGLGGK